VQDIDSPPLYQQQRKLVQSSWSKKICRHHAPKTIYQFDLCKGDQNTTSNQSKVMNSTYNYTTTATNKFFIENVLELKHKTLSKLNIEDVIGLHCMSIAKKMIQTNSIGIVPQ